MPHWARWQPIEVHPIVIMPERGNVSLTTELSNETDLQVIRAFCARPLAPSCDSPPSPRSPPRIRNFTTPTPVTDKYGL